MLGHTGGMDESKQLVTRSRHALACLPHNGSTNDFGQQGTDNARAAGTLASRYSHIVIKEPSTAEPKRAKRKRITAEQLKELTAVFENTDTPTHDIREALSKSLGMTNREVQVWFQNRRAKYNRQRLEQQRQLRTNAAIMFTAGMVPLHNPLPLQIAPYAHLPPQSPYPPLALTRPPTSSIDNTEGRTGDGHLRKCHTAVSAHEPYAQGCRPGPTQPYLAVQALHSGSLGLTGRSSVDVAQDAIAGTTLLQLSEARPMSATSPVTQATLDLARPPLGDPHRSGSYLGTHHMQTPALTSASAVAYCTYSASPSASPHRPSAYAASFRAANDEHMPQPHQHWPQPMQHLSSGALLPARRNTFSAYHSTSHPELSAPPDNPGPQPLVYPASPPITASESVCMVTRDRYRPGLPSRRYHRPCRYSTSKSPSPFQGPHHQVISVDPSAYELPAAAAVRGVKLPSIQAILANVGHAISGDSKTAPAFSLPLSRSRAYTSPPLSTANQGESQLRAGREDAPDQAWATGHRHMSPPTQVADNSFPPGTLANEPDGQHDIRPTSGARSHSPCANYYHESPVDEAKLAIDLLATAAVSVSSARSSCSLPHLTPLSEFSVRAGSQQQSSPTHTPFLPSQEAQVEETKDRPSRSWRPW